MLIAGLEAALEFVQAFRYSDRELEFLARIRRTKMEKVPYILVVGDDDVSHGTVGVNARGTDRPERDVTLVTAAAIKGIAAQQTIHRRRCFHVVLHIFDRGFLIGRQRVFKTFFEFALPGSVNWKRVTLDQLALSVKPQQLVRHIAHRALGLGFRLLPADATQTIERRLVGFSARVTLHEIEPLNRHVELRFFGVVQQQTPL